MTWQFDAVGIRQILEQQQNAVRIQAIKAHDKVEAAHGGFIHPLQQVGGGDEDAIELLQGRQELVDVRDLPVALRTMAATDEAVGLVD